MLAESCWKAVMYLSMATLAYVAGHTHECAKRRLLLASSTHWSRTSVLQSISCITATALTSS